MPQPSQRSMYMPVRYEVPKTHYPPLVAEHVAGKCPTPTVFSGSRGAEGRVIRVVPELSGGIEERIRNLALARKAMAEHGAALNAPMWVLPGLLKPGARVTTRQAARFSGRGQRDLPSHQRRGYLRYYRSENEAALLFQAWLALVVERVELGLTPVFPPTPVGLQALLPVLLVECGAEIPVGWVDAQDLLAVAEALRRTTESMPGLVLWLHGFGRGQGGIRVEGGTCTATRLHLVEPGPAGASWLLPLMEDPRAFHRTQSWLSRNSDPLTNLAKAARPSLFNRVAWALHSRRVRRGVGIENLAKWLQGADSSPEGVLEAQRRRGDRTQAPSLQWRMKGEEPLGRLVNSV